MTSSICVVIAGSGDSEAPAVGAVVAVSPGLAVAVGDGVGEPVWALAVAVAVGGPARCFRANMSVSSPPRRWCLHGRSLWFELRNREASLPVPSPSLGAGGADWAGAPRSFYAARCGQRRPPQAVKLPLMEITS